MSNKLKSNIFSIWQVLSKLIFRMKMHIKF